MTVHANFNSQEALDKLKQHSLSRCTALGMWALVLGCFLESRTGSQGRAGFDNACCLQTFGQLVTRWSLSRTATGLALLKHSLSGACPHSCGLSTQYSSSFFLGNVECISLPELGLVSLWTWENITTHRLHHGYICLNCLVKMVHIALCHTLDKQKECIELSWESEENTEKSLWILINCWWLVLPHPLSFSRSCFLPSLVLKGVSKLSATVVITGLCSESPCP